MRTFSFLLSALTVAIFCQATHGEDTPKRSPELQVLDRFVGTWDLVVTSKPAGGETVTGETTEIRRWTLGNKFVQWENPKTAKPDEPEFQMLMTFDPQTKTYPGVFMNGPDRALLAGTWDEATKTMTFKGSFSNVSGGTFSFTNRFIDADHCEASGTMRDASGKVFLELTQNQTRRKE